MNLLFFTIELERGRGGMGPEIQGGPRKRLAECVHLVRSSWRLQQLGVCAAGTAVWAICDRAPFVIGLPDWLPISARTPTDGPSTAQLNVTSVPADATVLVDGASAREAQASAAPCFSTMDGWR